MAMGTLNRLVGRLGGRPKDAQQSFDRGAAAVAAGDIEEGRLALVEAVNLAPEDLGRAYAAGELLAGVECSAEADQIFRHVAREIPAAVEAEPNNAELRQL